VIKLQRKSLIDLQSGFAHVAAIVFTAMLMLAFGFACVGWLFHRALSGAPPATPLVDIILRLTQDNRLHSAIIRTISLTGIALLLQFAVVLLILRFVRSMPNLVKILFVGPVLISQTTAALTAFLCLSPAIGPADKILRGLNLRPPNWFYETMPMGALAVFIDSWQWLPFLLAVLLYQAEKIPESYYEQARIEQASEWQIWKEVTLPMLLPTLSVLAVLRLFDWIRMYDITYVLFGGGGAGNAMETISVYVYKLTFQPGNERYGATIASIYLVITVTIFLCCLKIDAIKRLMPWELSPDR